jgi:hypothetical protein
MTSKNFIDVPTSKLIIGDSTSEDSLELVSRWLDDCVNSHENCNPNMNSPLPTRILDLQGRKGSPVRLCVTEGEVAAYACLSHCWGAAESLVLTRANLGKLTNAILISELPRTYVDAIDFCRRLGIRYLWVDSLCIIQKDAVDWSYEAARMSTYYGGCYVCLAATQAFDHNFGCCVSSLQLEYRGKGIDQLPYYVAVRERIPHMTEPQEYDHARYFPLLTRAWVYQERHMSPRVVHFCGYELVYECSRLTTCECERIPKSGSQSFRPKAEAIATAAYGNVIQSQWQANVASYSQLSLTLVTDRLPALSGLAKKEESSTLKPTYSNNTYLAGLWEQNLLLCLTWCVGNTSILTGNSSRHDSTSTENHATEDLGTSSKAVSKSLPFMFALLQRPAEYIAPSWSWASVLDPVIYLHRSYRHQYCQIRSVSTELATPDPTGGVTSGFIILKGRLLPSRWTLVQYYMKGHSSGSYAARPFRQHYFSLADIKGTRTQFGDRFEDRGMEWRPDYAINTEHKQRLKDEEILYLLPLIAEDTRDVKENCVKRVDHEDLTYVFLVLRSVTPADQEPDSIPVFNRVGYANHNEMPTQLVSEEELMLKLI